MIFCTLPESRLYPRLGQTCMIMCVCARGGGRERGEKGTIVRGTVHDVTSGENIRLRLPHKLAAFSRHRPTIQQHHEKSQLFEVVIRWHIPHLTLLFLFKSRGLTSASKNLGCRFYSTMVTDGVTFIKIVLSPKSDLLLVVKRSRSSSSVLSKEFQRNGIRV